LEQVKKSNKVGTQVATMASNHQSLTCLGSLGNVVSSRMDGINERVRPFKSLVSLKRSVPQVFMNQPVTDSYLPIVVLAIAAAGFAIAPLVLARLWAMKFSPRKPGPYKNTTYECGLDSKNDAVIQFRPEYYLYAIIFLIFDVEIIFLLPFAVAFTSLTIAPTIAMLVFLLLLAEGLVWAWQKGVLTWV
jgi:NADH:ubiquinone oxidoreductase subunit 3 (subunit A)